MPSSATWSTCSAAERRRNLAEDRGRHRSISTGRQAGRRRALPACVRQRCRRGEPAAVGLAVPPQSEQPGRRAGDLDRARGPGDRRPVRDDAGAGVDCRQRSARIVGNGRDGRARAPAPGARRSALQDLGPQRRRLARPRPVRILLQAVSEDAVAGSRPGAVLREAADPARVPAARTGRSRSTASCPR